MAERPSRLPAEDEFGNPMWWASSLGNDLCPVCDHDPDLHGSPEGCSYALPDTYTHMTDVELCGCPLQPVASDQS